MKMPHEPLTRLARLHMLTPITVCVPPFVTVVTRTGPGWSWVVLAAPLLWLRFCCLIGLIIFCETGNQEMLKVVFNADSLSGRSLDQIWTRNRSRVQSLTVKDQQVLSEPSAGFITPSLLISLWTLIKPPIMETCPPAGNPDGRRSNGPTPCSCSPVSPEPGQSVQQVTGPAGRPGARYSS